MLVKMILKSVSSLTTILHFSKGTYSVKVLWGHYFCFTSVVNLNLTYIFILVTQLYHPSLLSNSSCRKAEKPGAMDLEIFTF